MAITFLISHFTPTALLYFLLLSSSIHALNITTLLSPYPDFSDFTDLISSSISGDLLPRSSLTLLAVPNPFLSSTSALTRRLSPSSRADVLRYHTTGRATNNFGSVNLTRDPSTGVVSIRSPAPFSPSNATVLSLVTNLPYNVSIFSVNSLLVPYGFDLMASETRPPLGLNITKALIDGHNFNVAASMLAASGVVEEFEADEGGAGITLFVPTDTAFSNLPSNVRLQSLAAEKKAVVLKFHVLHSYYPLGSLESIVNPVQPTLATEDMGAGSYTLNISRINGSMAINTGIVQASVTQTVFDQKPVSIFGVSEVLLPREIFGKNPILTPKPGTPFPGIGGTPPPDISPSPESLTGPPSHLSSPPGFREEIRSEAAAAVGWLWSFGIASCCIGLYLMV
ncbi:fasciclin-like arabinogalactan protein 4 [Prunus yedoensis var. nudiflora]|uniref:Fasciclin-like arabinogalactan protein 4 n=1 Tax=Prunus yedoensis var. nudiflora TaxID=2094558 RepID=A0A314Z025_PRUYE|nr:fasciclin-like arabinogalactan protein 4 [Prunus yedoensis var. nudiflora]